MAKLLIAFLIVVAIVIGAFMVNGYRQENQGTMEEQPATMDSIEKDLRMDVDSGDKDFMELDSQIKTL